MVKFTLKGQRHIFFTGNKKFVPNQSFKFELVDGQTEIGTSFNLCVIIECYLVLSKLRDVLPIWAVYFLNTVSKFGTKYFLEQIIR